MMAIPTSIARKTPYRNGFTTLNDQPKESIHAHCIHRAHIVCSVHGHTYLALSAVKTRVVGQHNVIMDNKLRGKRLANHTVLSLFEVPPDTSTTHTQHTQTGQILQVRSISRKKMKTKNKYTKTKHTKNKVEQSETYVGSVGVERVSSRATRKISVNTTWCSQSP